MWALNVYGGVSWKGSSSWLPGTLLVTCSDVAEQQIVYHVGGTLLETRNFE